jgi:hypothetical protein
MVIYMDQYRTAERAPVAWLKNGTDGGDMMPAHWDSAVIQAIRETIETAPSPELPADLSTVDVEEFLGRVHGLATLI